MRACIGLSEERIGIACLKRKLQAFEEKEKWAEGQQEIKIRELAGC
jgi:hypothetical protein